MGVPLSHNPLWALATLEPGDAINSVDQLDEEMQGQSLTLLGHVSAIAERNTRELKRFLVVTLDLLGGQVEVMVWPDVLERTQGEWEEGKLVRASGKLRLRGEGFSLTCESVQEYRGAGGTTPEANGTSNSKGSSGYNGSSAANGDSRPNGSTAANSHSSTAANGKSKPKKTDRVPAESSNGSHARTVSLGVVESDDPTEDAHLLREVIGVLLEYPGTDRVNLEIHTGGGRVVMELPVVSTGYCEELCQRLGTLLGPDRVRLLGGIGDDAPVPQSEPLL